MTSLQVSAKSFIKFAETQIEELKIDAYSVENATTKAVIDAAINDRQERIREIKAAYNV